MFYTVYRITNLVNKKIYVGVHQTNNPNDTYFGSGREIKNDIKQFGKDKFIKEILFYANSSEEMYEYESKVVTKEFVESSDTYNIMVGGVGWKDFNSEYRKEISSKAGSWYNKEKRLKILESIPMSKRIEIGTNLGNKYGGQNKLDNIFIKERLKLIENVDLSKFGWVKKVSEILNISHTQVRRFIKKYYKGDVYERKINNQ
jgi:hypothetical protein